MTIRGSCQRPGDVLTLPSCFGGPRGARAFVAESSGAITVDRAGRNGSDPTSEVTWVVNGTTSVRER